jgi:23S rRNA maturation mini-RNase III
MIIYAASFTGVLNTLFTIALFYYGFKLFTKYVLPFILKRWVNKKMGQFQNQGKTQYQEQQKSQEFSKQNEGEVKIQSRGNKTKSDTKDMGDFVDYEEIE